MNSEDHMNRGEALIDGSPNFDEYITDVGFDLVKCRVYIESIDWQRLITIIESSSNKIELKSPDIEKHIHVRIVDEKTSLLKIPGNLWYSSIIIEYPYYKLQLIEAGERSLSPIPGNEDIRQLSIHVKPKNEDLGNLNNYECIELKNRTLEIFDELELYGIKLDRTRANINYFELNRNYCFKIRNDGISDKSCDKYEESRIGNLIIPFFYAAFCEVKEYLGDDSRKLTIVPKNDTWSVLGDAELEGVSLLSSTVGVHVYNKVLDIEENNSNVYIENPNIIRVEFVVKKEKQVISWLKTSNIFELDQDIIRNTYNRDLDRYGIEPFKLQHDKLLERVSQGGFDTSDKQWTNKVVKEVLFWLPQLNLHPGFVDYDDIKTILKMIDDELESKSEKEGKPKSRTIEMNMSRCFKKLKEKSKDYFDEIDYTSIVIECLKEEAKSFMVEYITID